MRVKGEVCKGSWEYPFNQMDKIFLERKRAEQNAHLTPESLSTSQAVVNASALEQSDGDSSPAQAQVA